MCVYFSRLHVPQKPPYFHIEETLENLQTDFKSGHGQIKCSPGHGTEGYTELN